MAGAADISGATTLTASQGQIIDGQLLCIGGGGLLNVTGTLVVGGGSLAGDAPDALLDIGGHTGCQLGGLSLAGGGSNAVTVDPTSWLEVGTAGNAAIGVLTVDAGSLASGCGTLNAYGPVIDNGTILAQGGTLVVGAASGTGSLAIDTEAVLSLAGADSCNIAFTGSGATLVLPAASLPTGVISGFAVGDSIVTEAPVDTLSFVPGAGGVGTLSLWAAGSLVGQLALAGGFAGEIFSVLPDGSGAAILLSNQAHPARRPAPPRRMIIDGQGLPAARPGARRATGSTPARATGRQSWPPARPIW